MKKTMLFILVLILVSCSKPAVPVSTPTEVAAATTFAEVSIAKPTETPTATPVPPTSTLDLLHVPTSTLQPAEICPPINEKLHFSLVPAFRDKKAPYHDARTVVLNFLNEGGNPQTAVSKLAEHNVSASLLDLTHDGVPEFILPSGYWTVFGCQNGKYVNLLDIRPSEPAQMTAVPLAIQDLNENGLLELFIGQVQSQDSTFYQILEWNGTAFSKIISEESQKRTTIHLYIENQVIKALGQSNAEKGALQGNWEIVDTDGNGLKDIIVHAGVTSYSSLEDSLILEWDGESYIVTDVLKEATPTVTPTATRLPFSETCSITVPDMRYQMPDKLSQIDQSILDYLNAGGKPEYLAAYYETTIRDLNGDTVSEIILIDYSIVPYARVFTCQSGKYVEAVEPRYDDIITNQTSIMTITDNNKNGFPEVFIEEIGCANWDCGALYVVEWNGDQFEQKVKGFDSGSPADYTRMDFPKDAYLKDMDGDGIAELIWRGELLPDWHGDQWLFYPRRLATHVFKWDGNNYTEQIVEYSAPKYRFQAVQDGDRYSKAGLYDKALMSYQQAITRDSLEWWTEDLHNSIMASHDMGPCAENPSTCPPLTEDPNERPVLSAYAYFKSMVVHLLMGKTTEAETTYQNLLSAYPAETPGFKITEMATSFWDEYQSTQDISKACAQSIAYIKTQSDVLVYLTGSNYSDQGIWYEKNPGEVCPFK